jgi:cell division protein FtsL
MTVSNKETLYRIKKGARNAAKGISASFMIFVVLMILSISFILYQLKEFQINKDIKEIRKLKNEIEELESLNHHHKSKIKNELENYGRISRLAYEMDLKEALTAPEILTLEKGKLRKYAEKDKKISQ